MCINMTGSVYGCIVPTWNRHAFVCGEVSAKVTEVQTERIQCNTVRDDAARMSLGCSSGLDSAQMRVCCWHRELLAISEMVRCRSEVGGSGRMLWI